MEWLLLLLPDRFLPLIFLGISFALIMGFVRTSWAIGMIGALIMFALLEPFLDLAVDSIIALLPFWVFPILAFFLFRFLLEQILGKEGAGSFLGRLAYDFFSFVFRSIFVLLAIPFRILSGILRRPL